MLQIHRSTCFKQTKVADSNPRNRLANIFSEKKDGIIKAITCANGSVQRVWMKKEETSSPNVHLEIIMLTSVIYDKEDRDVSTIYRPNLLIHTPIYMKSDEDKILIKLKEVMVYMLV